MSITETIPAGTVLRLVSQPASAFVVADQDIAPGAEHAVVRYVGGTPGYTWAEWTGNLARPRFNAVAF